MFERLSCFVPRRAQGGVAALLPAALLVILATGQAAALGCLDLPNARIDPNLAATSASLPFGSLQPNFRTRTVEAEDRRPVTVERLVGRSFLLSDDAGTVTAVLLPAGGTRLDADIGGERLTDDVGGAIAGLDAGRLPKDALAVLTAFDLAESRYTPPPLPDVAGAIGNVATPGRIVIAENRAVLSAEPVTARSETIRYGCSPDAEFAGNPANLKTLVVLKGVISADVVTTETLTSRLVDLTVRDLIEVEEAAPQQVIAQLAQAPGFSAAVAERLDPQAPDATPPAPRTAPPEVAVDSVPRTGSEAVTAVDLPPVSTDSREAQVAEGKAMALGEVNWLYTGLLGAALVALLAAIWLLASIRRALQQQARRSKKAYEKAALVARQKVPEHKPAAAVASKPAAPPAAAPEPEPGPAPVPADPVLAIGGEELSLREDWDRLQVRLSEAIQAAAQERSQYASLRAQSGALEQRLADLDGENVRLKGELARMKASFEETDGDNGELKDRVIALKRDLARALARLEASQAAFAEYESLGDAAARINADYRERHQAAEAENANLRARIDRLERELADQEARFGEIMRSNDELRAAAVDEQSGRVTAEYRYNELAKEHQAVRNEHETTIDRLSAERDELRAELDSERQSLTKLAGQIAEMNRIQRDSDVESQNLRQEIVRLKFDAETRSGELESNIADLNGYIDHLEGVLTASGVRLPAGGQARTAAEPRLPAAEDHWRDRLRQAKSGGRAKPDNVIGIARDRATGGKRS